MPFFYVSRVTNLTTPRSAPDLELLLRRSWAVFARQNYSINICQHKFFVSSRNTVKLWWNLLRVLKRPNSRACELEINASLLAPPDPCVPGPRAEDARGREALGTRMQLHYKIFRYLKPFSYPEPILRAVNGARQGALAKSISNWHLIGYNEGYCSNNVYIFYHVFMVSGFGFGQSPSSHRA
jgi:hypothetical protein